MNLCPFVIELRDVERSGKTGKCAPDVLDGPAASKTINAGNESVETTVLQLIAISNYLCARRALFRL